MAQGERSSSIIPQPPRKTGDPATDITAMLAWAWELYRGGVLESGLLDPSYQADAGTFDPANLPDPSNSTVARAQDTANRAYQLAREARDLLP